MNEGQLIIKYVKSEGMVHNLKRDNKELETKLESLKKQLRLCDVSKPFYCGADENHNAGRCKNQCRLCSTDEEKK